jgi:hypothetical protein
MHQFDKTLEKFDSNLWQYHIPIPENIALSLIVEDNKRVICTLNGQVSFQTALMKSEAYWFILVNKNHRDQLQVQEGQKLTVTLEKDNSEFGHEMPEEFRVLLDQDELGESYFKALTIGKQRSLVYIVTKVKNSQSRLNKALAILEHLKEAKGKLDFKKLNEKIKFYNNFFKSGQGF